MSLTRTEQAYHDGFLDGQRNILDIWDELVENSTGRTEAFEEFALKIEEIRKDIELS